MDATIPAGVRSLRSSVVLSIFIHALFCVTCLAFIRYQANHPSARPLMWVQLEPSSVQKPNKNKEDEQHRIVQSNAGHETKEAAPNAFLGEKTRVVDRETVNNKKVVQMGHTSLPDKTLTPPREDASKPRISRSPRATMRLTRLSPWQIWVWRFSPKSATRAPRRLSTRTNRSGPISVPSHRTTSTGSKRPIVPP